jgi:hypothetical protein
MNPHALQEWIAHLAEAFAVPGVGQIPFGRWPSGGW